MTHPNGTIAIIRIEMTGEEARCSRFKDGWVDQTNPNRFWRDDEVRLEVVRVLPVLDLHATTNQWLEVADAMQGARISELYRAPVVSRLHFIAAQIAEQVTPSGVTEPTEFGARVSARLVGVQAVDQAAPWLRMVDSEFDKHSAHGKVWTDGKGHFARWDELTDVEVRD